jgi:hypothetical protein
LNGIKVVDRQRTAILLAFYTADPEERGEEQAHNSHPDRHRPHAVSPRLVGYNGAHRSSW